MGGPRAEAAGAGRGSTGCRGGGTGGDGRGGPSFPDEPCLRLILSPSALDAVAAGPRARRAWTLHTRTVLNEGALV